MPASRPHAAIVAGSLVALVFVAYANSFQAGLTLDNAYIIGLDPRIRVCSMENLQRIWHESYWGPFARNDLYRPITTLSYLFNYAVLGNEDRVLGYHGVNVLLHAANVGLAFAVLRRLGASVGLAWLAAAIFAVHPMNVEAVTNIVGRADVLATLAVLGSGFCYMRASAATGQKRAGWLALTGFIACVGGFAKENAIMAVGFAVLYDLFWRWPGLDRGRGISGMWSAVREFGLKGWITFLPAIVLLFGVRSGLGATLTPAGQSFVDNPIQFAGLAQGTLTAIGVVGRYLLAFVFPANLSCDYSYGQIPLYGEGALWWQDWIPWLSLLAIAGLGVLAGRACSAPPLVGWGVAYFFLMLLPVSNLLVRIGSIMADRFLYLPSLGLCVVAAFVFQAIGRRLAQRAAVTHGAVASVVRFTLPAMILGALVARTLARNADWRDNRTIWQSAVQAAPNSFKAHLGFSEALWAAERSEPALDHAIAESETALRILETTPLPAERLPQTGFGQLGTFYRFKGELLAARNATETAQAYFTRSIEMLDRAREVDRRENEQLQRDLVRRGVTAPVVSGNPKIYLDLAVVQMHVRNWSALEAAAKELQRLAPSAASGYAFQAVAESNTRRDDDAAVHFLAALVLDRNDTEIRAHLAAGYERLGVRPAPVGLAASSALIDPTDPRVQRHVNAAFALLVRNHEAAGLRPQAEELRALAVSQFRVPAEMLAEKK